MSAKAEVHKISVGADRSMKPTERYPIIAGNVNVDEVKFTFEEPADWQDLNLAVYFTNSTSKVTEGVTDWDGEDNVVIPAEAIADVGHLEVAIIGTSVDDTDPENPVIIQRAVTQACPNILRVYPSGVNS